MPGKQNMTDREYMDDVLISAKSLSNLYNYATQESSTEPVHCNFKEILNNSLEMQHQIFSIMQSKGWYQQQQAEQQQINQVKTKFSN